MSVGLSNPQQYYTDFELMWIISAKGNKLVIKYLAAGSAFHVFL